MPMPHRTYAEVIKRRLVGKEGGDRVASSARSSPSCRATGMVPMPTCASGSRVELDQTRMRAKVVHRDSLAGAA